MLIYAKQLVLRRKGFPGCGCDSKVLYHRPQPWVYVLIEPRVA